MNAVSPDQLLEELQELRETVGVLRRFLPRHRISLAPIQPQRFLGQPLAIVAAVSDPVSGLPVADAPVTFAVSFGQLSGSDGFGAREGTAVTLRSGIDGIVRVALNARTSEPLRSSQQSAVESILSQLDAGAATPRHIRPSFESMAREYRWEANFEFRQAVDIYFRDFRQGLTETVNLRDYLESWSFFDTTIVAYAREDEAGDLDTQVRATAVLDFRFKDWIAPWFETYLALAEAESRLGTDFGKLKEENKRAGPLLEGIYGRAKEFVDRQRGRVGELAGNRIAEKAIQAFLKAGFADFELEERLTLVPALQVATASIARTGINVVATVGQSQKDLRKEITAKSDPRVGELGTKIGSLEVALAAKVDSAALAGALSQKADLAEFDTFRTLTNVALGTKLNTITFNTQFATKADLSELNAFQTATNNALSAKLDTAAFNTQIATKADLSELNAFRTATNNALSAKLDTAAFNTQFATKADLSELNTLRTTTANSLATKLNAATFTAFQTRMDTALAAKLDLAAFNQEMNRKVDKTEFTSFQTRIDQELGRRVTVTDFNTALATKTDVAAFTSFRDQTNRALETKVERPRFEAFANTIDTELGTLRETSRTLSTNLGTIERRIRRLPPNP